MPTPKSTNTDQDTTTATPSPAPSTADLLAALASLGTTIAGATQAGTLAAIKAAQPARVTIADILTDPTSVFYAEREKRLTRSYHVNGFGALNHNVATLSDRELELLEQLSPGRYIDQKVTIDEHRIGPDEYAVSIVYANKTLEQRMDFAKLVRNFEDLLRQCVDEATAAGRSRKGAGQ